MALTGVTTQWNKATLIRRVKRKAADHLTSSSNTPPALFLPCPSEGRPLLRSAGYVYASRRVVNRTA